MFKLTPYFFCWMRKKANDVLKLDIDIFLHKSKIAHFEDISFIFYHNYQSLKNTFDRSFVRFLRKYNYLRLILEKPSAMYKNLSLTVFVLSNPSLHRRIHNSYFHYSVSTCSICIFFTDVWVRVSVSKHSNRHLKTRKKPSKKVTILK